MLQPLILAVYLTLFPGLAPLHLSRHASEFDCKKAAESLMEDHPRVALRWVCVVAT